MRGIEAPSLRQDQAQAGRALAKSGDSGTAALLAFVFEALGQRIEIAERARRRLRVLDMRALRAIDGQVTLAPGRGVDLDRVRAVRRGEVLHRRPRPHRQAGVHGPIQFLVSVVALRIAVPAASGTTAWPSSLIHRKAARRLAW
jgi:hypothetical protein